MKLLISFGLLALCLFSMHVLASPNEQFIASARKLLASTSDSTPNADFYNSGNAPWLHELPRQTLAGDHVEPTLFITSSGDYYSSLAGIGIFCLGIAVGCAVAGFLFCILRFKADKCGGKEPSGEYTSGQNRAIAIMLVVVSVLILAMIGLGIAGNDKFQPALTDFFNTIEVEAKRQKANIALLKPVFDEVNYNRTLLRGYVDAVDKDGQATVDNYESGRNSIAGNNSWRLAMLGLTYGIGILVIILAMLGITLRIGKLTMSAGLISFFGMFLAWIALGLHFAFSVTVADLCYDVSSYTVHQRLQDRLTKSTYNETYYGGLDNLLHCPSYRNSNLTYGYVFELQEWSANQYIASGNSSIYLTYISELENIKQPALEIRDCSWIEPLLNMYQKQACGDYLDGLIIIWATAFVIAILLVFFAVLSIVASKRFTKSAEF